MELRDKKVTVVGLGMEGVALVRFLVRQGAQVTVSDSKPAERLTSSLEQIAGLPVRLSLGGNRPEDATGADIVFTSPGVPLDIPALAAARERGVPLSNSMGLFFDLCPCHFIVGITGSSGKTTTTALVGSILEAAGDKVFVGGNIGVTLVDKLAEITPDTRVVLEMSSFQLSIMGQSPRVAAITNITPNHLDQHRSMEEYIEAKKNIIRFQGAGDFAVLNADDPVTRNLVGETAAHVLLFSQKPIPEGDGVFLRDNWIILRRKGHETPILPVDRISLLGRHNWENVMTACAIAAACGVSPKPMAKAVAAFRGIPHRLEWVRELNGVDYYNDSIATTPERAAAALRSFDPPVVLLAGGRDKHLPLDPLVGEVRQHCKAVVLYGESAPLLEEALRGAQLADMVRCQSFSEAVAAAHRIAARGEVVLLSPACTSYDLFEDFQERGREFKRLVWELA